MAKSWTDLYEDGKRLERIIKDMNTKYKKYKKYKGITEKIEDLITADYYFENDWITWREAVPVPEHWFKAWRER